MRGVRGSMDQGCSEQTGWKVLAREAGSGPEKEWISEIDPLRTLQLLSTSLAGGYSEMLQIERGGRSGSFNLSCKHQGVLMHYQRNLLCLGMQQWCLGCDSALKEVSCGWSSLIYCIQT